MARWASAIPVSGAPVSLTLAVLDGVYDSDMQCMPLSDCAELAPRLVRVPQSRTLTGVEHTDPGAVLDTSMVPDRESPAVCRRTSGHGPDRAAGVVSVVVTGPEATWELVDVAPQALACAREHARALADSLRRGPAVGPARPWLPTADPSEAAIARAVARPRDMRPESASRAAREACPHVAWSPGRGYRASPQSSTSQGLRPGEVLGGKPMPRSRKSGRSARAIDR